MTATSATTPDVIATTYSIDRVENSPSSSPAGSTDANTNGTSIGGAFRGDDVMETTNRIFMKEQHKHQNADGIASIDHDYLAIIARKNKQHQQQLHINTISERNADPLEPQQHKAHYQPVLRPQQPAQTRHFDANEGKQASDLVLMLEQLRQRANQMSFSDPENEGPTMATSADNQQHQQNLPHAELQTNDNRDEEDFDQQFYQYQQQQLQRQQALNHDRLFIKTSAAYAFSSNFTNTNNSNNNKIEAEIHNAAANSEKSPDPELSNVENTANTSAEASEIFSITQAEAIVANSGKYNIDNLLADMENTKRRRSQQTTPASTTPTTSRTPGIGARRSNNTSMSKEFHGHNGHTVPVEFKFHLSRRKPEDRTEDMLVELKRNIMSECTFTPNINPHPSYHAQPRPQSARDNSGSNAGGGSFFERALKWKEEKAKEVERLAEERKKSELEPCTFKPNINSTSAADNGPSSPLSTAERLYQQSFIKKQQLEEQRKKAEEDAVKESCTFKPQTNRHKSPVVSRYLDTTISAALHQNAPGASALNTTTNTTNPGLTKIQAMIANDVSANSSDVENCTFTPSINKVKNSFVSAKMYLEENAFERLSRPRTPTQQVRRSSSSMSLSPDTNSNDSSSIRSGSQTARRPASPRLDYGSDSETRFQTFLQRQQQLEQRKKEKLKDISRALAIQQTGDFKPRLCDKSRQLVSDSKDKPFIERMENRMKRSEEKKKQLVYKDKNCTFKPAINPTSAKLKPRSVEELSKGDAEKQRQKIEQLKKVKADEELRGVTFEPRLNKNDNVQSRLQILEDPDHYLERVQKLQEHTASNIQKLKTYYYRKETEECTFHPEVHDAPEYIKRIAKSIALTKGDNEHKKKEEQKQVREWR